MKAWKNNLNHFVALVNNYGVRMIMVGGAAVQFHGYHRNSLDVDFWIDTTKENLDNLILVFKDMGYELDDLPEKVKNKEQNISIKFSPVDLDVELITNFSVNKTFDDAYKDCEEFLIGNSSDKKYMVLSLNDLIVSKVKSGRPKDLLDIQELTRIHKLE